MAKKVAGVRTAQLLLEVHVTADSKAEAREIAQLVKENAYDLSDVDGRIVRVKVLDMRSYDARKEKRDRAAAMVGRIPKAPAAGGLAQP